MAATTHINPADFLRDVRRLATEDRATVLIDMNHKYGLVLTIILLAGLLTDILEGLEEGATDGWTVTGWIGQFPSPQGDDVGKVLIMTHAIVPGDVHSEVNGFRETEEHVSKLPLLRRAELARDLATFLGRPELSGMLTYSDEEYAQIDQAFQDHLVSRLLPDLETEVAGILSADDDPESVA